MTTDIGIHAWQDAKMLECRARNNCADTAVLKINVGETCVTLFVDAAHMSKLDHVAELLNQCGPVKRASEAA